ncbi:hypothetical protein BDV95DRAFT_583347 [Massariosphaeria phaeospora]|uniref:Zn(2)-C6 fungal-type domain-containing protein n=1 Tax=Massariosphaeria phaeospora TaxID=100035 RepID=A0A7C8M3D9_9PLEO|nr:hypothetical protein BDV95DRAFT_583347 [Massariosphaeria phaeospora]
MSANSSSRRRSCSECVKAKRKCGMELPRCRRCEKKDILCSYPTNTGPSLSDMPFPELEFPWLDDLMRDPNVSPWSGTLQPQLAGSSASYTAQIEPDVHPAPQGVPEYLVAVEGRTRTTLTRPETEAALHRFRTWPHKWLWEGKAPFIHPRLYASSMPKPLQDAYAACAIYSTKNERNEFVAFTVIEAKANELVQSPNQHSWTPLDLLAAVQALLIYQFIRLFDGDIRQRALAEAAEPVLAVWAEQLKSRTEEEQRYTTATAPSWRSWVFSESVRRTITMSYMLHGIYSFVKRGYCTMSEKVKSNSFTAQRELWDASSALEWERIKQSHDPHWIHNMDFNAMLQHGRGAELDDFGLLMLITYKGKDITDHWLAATMSDSYANLIMDPNFHGTVRDMAQAANHCSSSRSTSEAL